MSVEGCQWNVCQRIRPTYFVEEQIERILPTKNVGERIAHRRIMTTKDVGERIDQIV